MQISYSRSYLVDGESDGADSEKGALPDREDAPPPPPLRSALSEQVEKDPHPIEGAWAEPKNLWIIARYKAVPFVKKMLTHGMNVDIHALQASKGDSAEGRRIAEVHARAKQ